MLMLVPLKLMHGGASKNSLLLKGILPHKLAEALFSVWVRHFMIIYGKG